jgi:hypothetical protein
MKQKSWHLFYEVDLICSEGTHPPFHGDLQKYCKIGEVALPDHTVAYVHAKAWSLRARERGGVGGRMCT